MISQRSLFASWALGFAFAFSSAEALAVSMTDLFQGSTITADDKLFTDFTLIDVQTINGGVADLGLIDVQPLVNDPLNPGIKFIAPMPPNFVPALGTPFGHTGPSSVSVIFSFNVRTTSGLPLITDNSLLINGFLFDSGPNAFIQITEQVSDANGNPLGDKLVIARPGDQPNSGNPNHFDSLEFSPQALVHVRKSISIVGPQDNNGAFLTMFEQRFSQVPEPSTLLMLMIAAASWCLRRGRVAEKVSRTR
jgi:hypothetical protein